MTLTNVVVLCLLVVEAARWNAARRDRELLPVSVGMRIRLVMLFVALAVSVAHADAYRARGALGRTAWRFVDNLERNRQHEAYLSTAPTLRYGTYVTDSCLHKYPHEGVITGEQRALLLACYGHALAVRIPDTMWATASSIAHLPSKPQQKWARRFPKATKFIVGSHEGGFIIVALAPGKTPRKVSGIWLDDDLLSKGSHR